MHHAFYWFDGHNSDALTRNCISAHDNIELAAENKVTLHKNYYIKVSYLATKIFTRKLIATKYYRYHEKGVE